MVMNSFIIIIQIWIHSTYPYEDLVFSFGNWDFFGCVVFPWCSQCILPSFQLFLWQCSSCCSQYDHIVSHIFWPMGISKFITLYFYMGPVRSHKFRRMLLKNSSISYLKPNLTKPFLWMIAISIASKILGKGKPYSLYYT